MNFGKIYCRKLVHYFLYKKGLNQSIFIRKENSGAKVGENKLFLTHFLKIFLDMGLKYTILMIKEKIGIVYYFLIIKKI